MVYSEHNKRHLHTFYPNGLITLAVSGTRTTTDMQKPFTLAVSGTRTRHLNTIEIPLNGTPQAVLGPVQV